MFKPGHRVLDVCAAPGGKTAHILERQPQLKELVAVDIDESRMQRVSENLQRLKLQAKLVVGDAANPRRLVGWSSFLTAFYWMRRVQH